MRTTIDVSPDVLAAAGALATDRGESIDEIVVELLRAGLDTVTHLKSAAKPGQPSFAAKRNLTSAEIDAVIDSMDEEDDLYKMNACFPKELPIVINPRSGLPMFDQPVDAPPIRPEMVQDAMAEESDGPLRSRSGGRVATFDRAFAASMPNGVVLIAVEDGR